MDTLALLCNLHADGPATLQRLRRAGFESIGALQRLDAGRLAETLAWSERAAVRFLREAALLRERVDEDEAEEPEAPELEATLLGELDGDQAASEAETEPELDTEDGGQAQELVAAAPLPAERVQAVLGAWRELDRVTPPGDPDEFVIPRPPPPADRALAAAGLAGLSPQQVDRLRELGITTVRQLLAQPELGLARALPLGFTRVRHLHGQARRLLERLPPDEPQAAAPAASAFRAFTPPASEPFETAGPFA